VSISTIAFYLPQFHPIPENDEWWGKGFTEWTNVAKAKPLYRGHQQPFLPADLGFYDLRVPEVREKQAELAKKAGITAFAYWHYWFGNGKRLLERPLKEVLATGTPDFPFCLAWANETWSGRWHGLNHKILIEQLYPGRADETAFFYDSLPYFQDSRYLRVNGECIMVVYRPNYISEPVAMLDLWRELGYREGITFHFVGIGDPNCINYGFDAFIHNPRVPMEAQFSGRAEKVYYKIFGERWQKHLKPALPDRFDYKRYVEGQLNSPLEKYEYPMVLTGWDNTPRSGPRGMVLENESPKDYEVYLRKAVQKVTGLQYPFIFLKSWNEWAEGNVLEPSQKWGNAYLDATAKVLL
jgi:hypothetical protein